MYVWNPKEEKNPTQKPGGGEDGEMWVKGFKLRLEDKWILGI